MVVGKRKPGQVTESFGVGCAVGLLLVFPELLVQLPLHSLPSQRQQSVHAILDYSGETPQGRVVVGCYLTGFYVLFAEKISTLMGSRLARLMFGVISKP